MDHRLLRCLLCLGERWFFVTTVAGPARPAVDPVKEILGKSTKRISAGFSPVSMKGLPGGNVEPLTVCPFPSYLPSSAKPGPQEDISNMNPESLTRMQSLQGQRDTGKPRGNISRKPTGSCSPWLIVWPWVGSWRPGCCNAKDRKPALPSGLPRAGQEKGHVLRYE